MLIGGDLGCLLHLAGRMERQGKTVEVRHVAEVLADMGDEPALGEPHEPGSAQLSSRPHARRSSIRCCARRSAG